MKAIFVCLLVLASFFALTTAYHGQRLTSQYNRNYYRPYQGRIFRTFNGRLPVTTPPVDPGTTPDIMKLSEDDDREASDKGVRVPFGDCVTSWNDFKAFVADREWISLYVIDDDEDLEGNRGIAYKFAARWTVENETIINRQGSLWWTATQGCVFTDGEFQRIDEGGKAIFGAIQGNAFITANRRDIFVCSKTHPITWCIFYICYDFDKVVDGRCPNTEIFLMVREQRDSAIESNGYRKGPIILNDVPWSEIAIAFKDCLGQEFKDDTDPQLRWNWVTPTDTACPIPGTQAFADGVANG